MIASTTVEASASAAVKSSAVIPVEAATCVAPMVAASNIAAGRGTPVAVSWPITIRRSVTIAGPVAVSRTVVAVSGAAIIAPSVVAVIPGTGADKHAACKVARPVISVRRAGVGVVAVITVKACRSWADTCVAGTNSNADGNLRLRRTSGEKQNPKQREIL
jgi:hypothetical protein